MCVSADRPGRRTGTASVQNQNQNTRPLRLNYFSVNKQCFSPAANPYELNFSINEQGAAPEVVKAKASTSM
jgi:hypothetical protein